MNRYIMSTLYNLGKHLQEQKGCDLSYDGFEHTALVLLEIAIKEVTPDYFRNEHNKEIWEKITKLYEELE